MYDNQSDGQYFSVRRLNEPRSIRCGLIVGILLLWNNAHANIDELATAHILDTADVNVHVDSQPLAVQHLDASEVVEANDKGLKTIAIDPASSDVVQLDTGKLDQNSRLDLTASSDLQSVDVAKNDSSVKFSPAVYDIGDGVDDQNAIVEMGDHPMAAMNELSERDDQPLVAGASANLPVTIAAAEAGNEGTDVGGQLKDAADDAIGEEKAGLPYAVVLALLALIGLVPVARRNDHYRM